MPCSHKLAAVNVHVDPCGHGGQDPHASTAHHAPVGLARQKATRQGDESASEQ